MKKLTISKLAGIGLLVIVLLLAIGIVGSSVQSQQQPDGQIALNAPPFIRTAHAEGDAINSFADDEAGIAAYFDAGMTINLNDVDQLYRTIETQTSTYILGSMPLTDYDEDHDVHMYISTDGWVMAYYRNTEPTSKIFDWRHYDGSANLPNKLSLGLDIVAAEIGAVATPDYYHFNYPNATDLMLIAERTVTNNPDDFEINIPPTFSYYERSWSLASNANTTNEKAWYYLNGTEIAAITSGNGFLWNYLDDTFSAVQVPPDTLHTISLETRYFDAGESAYGGLALVYQVP